MKHCLVIDDSDIIRKVARRVLEELNVTSTEADSGAQGLELCRAAMPDLILVDWIMPGMSGLEFVTQLRGQPDGELPIIVYCTSVNDPDDYGRALAAGVDKFLLKPFDRNSFRDALKGIEIN